MKKVLLFATCLAFICSCSENGDSEPEKSITVESSEMTVRVGDFRQVDVNVVGFNQEDVEWRTSDDFVVDVDSRGEIEAKHVGYASVYASIDNLADSCLVTVEGNYNTFVEPYVLLGATKEEIKSKEKRKLKKEDDESLVYEDSNSIVEMIMYSFESGRLTGAGAILDLYETDATELGNFFNERYDYIGESDGIMLLTNGKVAVGIKVESYGISIVYIEDTVTKSSSYDYYIAVYKEISSKMYQLKK